MEFKANTVLITGGATGIGFALAEQFVQAGSSVIICGRREDKLKEAQSKHPQL
ncbi:MAG TPA: short-chain dehydrogenase, partial [Desulfobacteraceae bacterium]|nr:short-chain dehydrogenase [Desulfobacteraceae bacterium]